MKNHITIEALSDYFQMIPTLSVLTKQSRERGVGDHSQSHPEIHLPLFPLGLYQSDDMVCRTVGGKLLLLDKASNLLCHNVHGILKFK